MQFGRQINGKFQTDLLNQPHEKARILKGIVVKKPGRLLIYHRSELLLLICFHNPDKATIVRAKIEA
jgi:hypothetical protein